MKKTKKVGSFILAALLFVGVVKGHDKTIPDSMSDKHFIHHSIGNPYLPLWEHLPDGEPRVFEDPDNPGKFRAYIIGSHDLRLDSYCGPDINNILFCHLSFLLLLDLGHTSHPIDLR